MSKLNDFSANPYKSYSDIDIEVNMFLNCSTKITMVTKKEEK